MEPTEQNRRAWDAVHGPLERASAGLPAAVAAALPELRGKHVLHLGCGTGEASAELAALGALVTGVDASADAVAAARERAPSVAFVVGDPDGLPVEVRRGRFDLVYSPVGTQLEAWAAGIVSALRPDGELVVYDAHPVLECLDESLRWREDYFEEGRPRLGDVFTALADAGLVVRSLAELPAESQLRPQLRRVPGAFLLRASRLSDRSGTG
jgi:SAM-dependent methyltransferase